MTNLPPVGLPVVVLVVALFMVFAAGRMVPIQALLVGVAEPRHRGTFLSLNTAVQHVATGFAPVLAGWVVVKTDAGLTGYPTVGLIAAGCALLSIVLAGWLKPRAKDADGGGQARRPASATVMIPAGKPAAI
jgi:predicted MFS family arabinose efflux permease